MQRGKKTNFILRQFKRKSKKIVNKDYFTEFFYHNKEREIIEFLKDSNGNFIMDSFFKKFIPDEFKEFINVKVYNMNEEEIKLWYYTQEDLVFVINVNWGIKKQEISIEIDIENFEITIIDDKENVSKKIDYVMFNDYLISFLTLQARNLAEAFNKITN